MKLAFNMVAHDEECIKSFNNISYINGWPLKKVTKDARVMLTSFAFHARAEVEFAKHRAIHADRAVDTKNKLMLRELLKVSKGANASNS